MFWWHDRVQASNFPSDPLAHTTTSDSYSNALAEAWSKANTTPADTNPDEGP